MSRTNRRVFLGAAAAGKLLKREYRLPYKHPYQG